MFKCTYCERELKSNAGKVRHENSCKARDIGGQLGEDVESPETELFVDDIITEEIQEEDTYTKDELSEKIKANVIELSSENYTKVISSDTPREEVRKIIQLEVLGGESTYYDGHPRRLIKLRGLLTRTYDRNERAKIYNMILELS